MPPLRLRDRLLTAVAVRSPLARRVRRKLTQAPEPVSRVFGLDRGTPVDRWYIDRFLQEASADIRGRVLEFEEPLYARRYAAHVESVAILHPTQNRHATIVADLGQPETAPENAFDCVIATQVLQYVFDTEAAVASLARMLVPGGVALVTLPTVSRISPGDQEAFGEYWRFAPDGARRLFADRFDATVQSYGNVATACAFLQGLAVEDLDPHELEAEDEAFPVLVSVRAVKR